MLNIIITCFIFGYVVTSIVFLLICISKGEDGLCLRIFRLGMPLLIWLVLISVYVMENIAYFRVKSQLNSLSYLPNLIGCIPPQFVVKLDFSVMISQNNTVYALTTVMFVVHTGVSYLAMKDVRASKNRD